MKALGGHTGDPDAAGLNGQDLVDGLVGKQTLKLHAHLVKQFHIHQMVEKAVHLQHIALGQNAVLADTIFQQFHRYANSFSLCDLSSLGSKGIDQHS